MLGAIIFTYDKPGETSQGFRKIIAISSLRNRSSSFGWIGFVTSQVRAAESIEIVQNFCFGFWKAIIVCKLKNIDKVDF